MDNRQGDNTQDNPHKNAPPPLANDYSGEYSHADQIMMTGQRKDDSDLEEEGVPTLSYNTSLEGGHSPADVLVKNNEKESGLLNLPVTTPKKDSSNTETIAPDSEFNKENVLPECHGYFEDKTADPRNNIYLEGASLRNEGALLLIANELKTKVAAKNKKIASQNKKIDSQTEIIKAQQEEILALKEQKVTDTKEIEVLLRTVKALASTVEKLNERIPPVDVFKILQDQQKSTKPVKPEEEEIKPTESVKSDSKAHTLQPPPSLEV